MKKVNPTNIFICKLLLDPNNKYKLNYNEGDTLKINIKKLWGLDGFDAVIGNPPYNNPGGISKGGKNLYKIFTIFAINNTNKNGYILYIVPTGILKTTIYNKKTDIITLIKMHQLLCLNINDCAKYFNVSSTFSYFLLLKNFSNSNIIYNIKTKIKDLIFEVNKIDNFDLNFIPLILTKESISIINKCSLYNLNIKRIDNNNDIKNKIEYDKFLYIKRLNHINYKNSYLKVYIGDKNIKINGPILYTKYSINKELLLKSKLFAFFNIILRFDGVIYHNFINMFGIDDNIEIKDINEYFNFSLNEIKLINSIID